MAICYELSVIRTELERVARKPRTIRTQGERLALFFLSFLSLSVESLSIAIYWLHIASISRQF